MAFTKVVGPGIHTLAQLRTHNIHSAGIITATRFVGEIGAGTGNTSTFTNVNVTGNLTVQGDTTTLNTTLRNVELLRVAANSTTTAGIITQTGAGDILNLFDGTSEVLTVVDTGEVGIGTVAPNAPLDVFSNTAATDKDLFMVRSATGAFGVQCSNIATANPEWRLRTYALEPIVFSPGNVEKLRIDSDGRFHIGSSNNTGSNTKLIVGAGNNINTTAIINTGDVDTDALTLSNWDGSTTTNKVTIHFDSSGIGGWNIGMPAATDAFVVEDDGGTEKLRIDGSGRLSTGAGISTEVAAGGMHIYQSSAGNNLVSLILENHGTTTNTSTELKFVPSDASPNDRYNSIRVLDVDGTNKFDTTFFTCPGGTPTEKFRITNAGHIVTQGLSSYSFNNDTANCKILEVTGDGSVGEYGIINISSNQNADSTNVGTLRFVNRENSHSSSGNNAGSKQVAAIQAYLKTSDTNAGDDSGGWLSFFTKNEAAVNAEALRITQAGTVNIGANFTQTTYKAQITTGTNKHISFGTAAHDDVSNEGSGIFFSRQSDGSKELSGLFSHSNGALGIAAREGLTFHVAGGSAYGSTDEALRITPDSKVGIGTDDPATHLQLAGTDANLQFRVTKEGVGSFNHGVDSTGAFLETLSSDNIPIRFYTGGGERLRITSAGKVGIGTNDPKQPVSITGRVSIDAKNDYYGVWADGDTAGENHISVGRWYNTGGGLKSGYSQYGINNLILENNHPTAAHALIIQPKGQKVAIGTHITDGLVHIGQTSAGSVEADAGGDELVLESSGNTGLSILSPGTGESTIFFGNPGTNGQKDGYIRYWHESHSTTANRRCLTFVTGGGDSERLRIDSSGNTNIGAAAANTAIHASGLFNGATPKFEIKLGAAANSYTRLINITNPGAQTGSETLARVGIKLSLGSEASGGESNKSGIIYAESTSGYNNGTALCLATNNTERLRIKSDGKIKLGTSNSTTDYVEWGSNPRLWLKCPDGINGLRIDANTTPFEIRNTDGNGRAFSFGSGGVANFDATFGGDYSLSAGQYDSSPKLFFNATRHNGSTTVTSFQTSIQAVATSNTNNTGYLGLGGSAAADDLCIDTSGDVRVTSGKLGVNCPLNEALPAALTVRNGGIYLEQGNTITWNNGDNYIKGESGYHLLFTTYDGSSNTDKFRIRGGSGVTNTKIQLPQGSGGFYHSHNSAAITPANNDWIYFGYVPYGSGRRGQFVVEWSSIHAPGCCYHGYAILEAGSSHGPDYDYDWSESLELLATDNHGGHNFKAWKLVDSSSSSGSHLKIFGRWSGTTVQSGTFHVTVLPGKTMLGATIQGANPAIDNNSYNGTRLTIDGNFQQGNTGYAPAQLRLNKSMFGIFHASSGLDTAGAVTTRGLAAGPQGTLWCNYGGHSATRNSGVVGSYTPFAGMVAPNGSGARYLHVKFNITGGSMWLIDIKGYEYIGSWTSEVNGSSHSSDKVHHSISGGYHYNSQALYNGKSIAYRGVDPGWYLSGSYVCCYIDTTSTQTSNRWGFYKFEGGTDGIIGVSQQKPSCVLAYTYSTGTGDAF